MKRPDKAAIAAELNERAREALAISNQIMPLLAGKGPDVQGATLANLLATWVAGYHPPEVRGIMLATHMAQVLALAELEAMKRGE